MSDILRMDEYRPDPHVTIIAGKAVHVYSLAYLRSFAEGKTVQDSLPFDVQRAIVREWLESLPEPEA